MTVLNEVITALQSLFSELEKGSQRLSFTIIVSKAKQGIHHLLKQSKLRPYTEQTLEHAAIFFDKNGIVLRLQEEWLMQNNDLLARSLRLLDRCLPPLRISAIAMGIAITDLLDNNPAQIEECIASHKQLWQWVQESLPHAVASHIIFTRMDCMAGFCEFFHQDLRYEHKGVLGFYPDANGLQEKKNEGMNGYSQLLHHLNQQVLNKLHPVRSTVKRTLIREFPLQMQSIAPQLKRLFQQLNIAECKLRAVYFTSSQQGGKTLDTLNARIQHEYSLCLPHYHYQAHNNQNYFIDGCLQDILLATQLPLPQYRKAKKMLPYVLVMIACSSLFLSTKQYWYRSRQLDTVSQELLRFEQLLGNDRQSVNALYHLGQADQYMQGIRPGFFTPSSVMQFQNQLHQHTQDTLRQIFLPQMLQLAEHRITQAGLSTFQYFNALRTYLMLGDPARFNENVVLQWYKQQWQGHPNLEREIRLVQQSLRQPLQAARLNEQIINDARNTLNALPDGYFYYTLARENFSNEEMDLPVNGFKLNYSKVPVIFTKQGYRETLERINQIIPILQYYQWVTARPFPEHVKSLILEAYVYEYRNWWQNFLRQSHLQDVATFEDVQHLLQTLRMNDSFHRLIKIIQEETSPIANDDPRGVFNAIVSKEFNPLNWLSETSINNLQQQMLELEKFVSNINLLKDQQESLFELTRQRFINPNNNDPLSMFYQSLEHYPAPVKDWSKQIADNVWFMLMYHSKAYIEQQWQTQVWPVYTSKLEHKYPFDSSVTDEAGLTDFYDFFSTEGTFNRFIQYYIRPFLDTRKALWKKKEINGYSLPLNPQVIQQCMLVNIIHSMFFKTDPNKASVHFSVEKINLDSMLKSLSLQIGNERLQDTLYNENENVKYFNWPAENAVLELETINGKKLKLQEQGPWAIFKLLDKMNIVPDEQNPSTLQILFEINGNSGRYSLYTQNKINPFTPGIFLQFHLPEHIT